MNTKILCAWLLLQAYHDYLAFLLMINEAVKGKKVSDDYPVSEVCVVALWMHVRTGHLHLHCHGVYIQGMHTTSHWSKGCCCCIYWTDSVH